MPGIFSRNQELTLEWRRLAGIVSFVQILSRASAPTTRWKQQLFENTLTSQGIHIIKVLVNELQEEQIMDVSQSL